MFTIKQNGHKVTVSDGVDKNTYSWLSKEEAKKIAVALRSNPEAARDALYGSGNIYRALVQEILNH